MVLYPLLQQASFYSAVSLLALATNADQTRNPRRGPGLLVRADAGRLREPLRALPQPLGAGVAPGAGADHGVDPAQPRHFDPGARLRQGCASLLGLVSATSGQRPGRPRSSPAGNGDPALFWQSRGHVILSGTGPRERRARAFDVMAVDEGQRHWPRGLGERRKGLYHRRRR
jgi:hypothetical protein